MCESLWLRELAPALDWRSGTSRVRAWNASALELSSEGTHYVFAYAGASILERGKRSYPLDAGMFAAVPGSFVVNGAAAEGAGLVITHHDYRGCFQLGGPSKQRAACGTSMAAPTPSCSRLRSSGIPA